jgi:hypothetical protein
MFSGTTKAASVLMPSDAIEDEDEDGMGTGCDALADLGHHQFGRLVSDLVWPGSRPRTDKASQRAISMIFRPMSSGDRM